MNPKNNTISGMRQPTVQEKSWIAEKWCPEVRGVRPNAGKALRYVGIFCVCMGAANMLRGGGGISGLIILLVVGAVCILFANFSKNAARQAANRKNALSSGNYSVAPAESCRIWYGDLHTERTGHVDVCSAGGEKHSYEIPYACAKPLLEQNIQQVPLLLIQIPGDPEILAIPVQK